MERRPAAAVVLGVATRWQQREADDGRVRSFTSLGHRRKKSGTTTMMLQNVTQKTTSERRNRSKSPEERPEKVFLSRLSG